MSFKSGVTTRVDNAQAILDALKSLTKRMCWSVYLRKTAIGMMCRSVMPGLGISTNTVHLHKTSHHVRILYPALNQLKIRRCHSLKLRHRLRLMVMRRERKSTQPRRYSGCKRVKNHIKAANFTPLADSTVEARARRGRKGAKAELARRAAGESPGTTLAKPLYDTGKYLASITHVVRDKDADS